MAAQVKIIVFVPKTHADIIRKALGEAGAGKIGRYTYCSYSVNGFGRYIPTKGAKPFLGKVGGHEQVEEERIECVCDRDKAKEAITAMKKVHPYEEVAFDIYPLISEDEL